MIKEFCAENFTHIPQAVQAGANRIELCDNLAAGGTTPSMGVIQTTVEYCQEHNVEVMVMIRPRAGDFQYNSEEVLIMCRDIAALQFTPIDGIVLGALKDGWIDEPVMEELLRVADDLEVTFHMAFDEILPELQFQAIDWLVDHGVKRILTHGGPLEQPITDHILTLKNHIQYANHRISLMAGGGVTYENAEEVARTLVINEVHGTRIVNITRGTNNETID